MAVDFYLDPVTNDLDLSNNKTLRLTANKQESSRQQVYISLSTNQGEWFANILAGIPYIENDNNPVQLLGTADKTGLDIAIKEGIISRENIISLDSYSSNFNKATRVFSAEFSATTDTGEVVSDSINIEF